MVNIPKEKKRPWIAQTLKTGKKKVWGDPEHQKIYQSAEWRRFRLDYLVENPWCVKCNQPATVVDHIKRIRDGGDIWEMSNLQAMCKRCHNKKTAKESNT